MKNVMLRKRWSFNWILFGLLVLVCLVPCEVSGQIGRKRKENLSENLNNSVFRNNAVVADNNYYSRAVLEYKLVKELLKRYGSVFKDFEPWRSDLYAEYEDSLIDDKEKGKLLLDSGILVQAIFGKNESDMSYLTRSDFEFLKKFKIPSCRYKLPIGLGDLTSGFQFRHYAFSASNRAAMQAFGISDTEFESESLFLITDYLQYADCYCAGLPTMRYAVGVRSELKMKKMKVKQGAAFKGGLASLAAQVEMGNMEIDITVKTIGITGLGSRLSIPSDVSFDVESYKDFQNIISFVKQLGDTNSGLFNMDQISFHPELVPVMDEYRTNLVHSYKPVVLSLDALSRDMRRINRFGNRIVDWKDADPTLQKEMVNNPEAFIHNLGLYTYLVRRKAIENQLRLFNRDRQELLDGQEEINNFQKYIDMFHELNQNAK